jgi:hypothetical protein
MVLLTSIDVEVAEPGRDSGFGRASEQAYTSAMVVYLHGFACRL